MKNARTLLAIIVVLVTAVGCDASPTAPETPPPPIIGSGTGT